MEPGSSSMTSVSPNPDLIHGVNPLDTVVDVLNLNLGLGLGAVRDRDSKEERRMREVQWKIIECIREGTGGWSLEVFEMVGGPGVEEDGEMWVVNEEGRKEGGQGGREGREGRDGEGDGVEEEGEKNMYPLEGSLIRAIVETMPNLRNFPKIHVHPETPTSLVSYTFYSLPYLSSFHINPSEPLDPRTIEFIAACTNVIGEVAGENERTESGLTSTIPGTSASASASMTGSRNTSSMGKRRKNMELEMQIGDEDFVMPIWGWD
ncbi:hypothetical protein K435DRAFT_864998 [Dendrothele bispora CBS 962.96]|uniref:Uncharacterized protein n=1 Tax=Dendrothele bispora (strain CBS 962.96) TaxID=1314807 RepID=A0A4S8LKN3_DENBC|nr:hypothetical protein K435DRAFT_864998 [Dendrothele bispora CBS 962.96]